MLVKLCSVWIAGPYLALQKFVSEILMYLNEVGVKICTLKGRVGQRAKRMEMGGLDSKAHTVSSSKI